MATVQGHACDVCEKFVRLPLDTPADQLPDGWIVVILPGTTRDVRPHERTRHICSGECLTLFAIERAEAERPAKAA